MPANKSDEWKRHQIAADVAFTHTFKTADVDKDGNLDVIAAEMEQSPKRRVSVYFNEGKALKWRQQITGWTGSHNLRLADIGSDGDIDIIGANHGNYGGATPVDLWENLLSNPVPTTALDKWKRHVIDPEKPWGATFVHAGDLNGDGLQDIITGGWWYKNPGQSSYEWERGESPDRNRLADINNDGRLDAVVGFEATNAPGKLAWYEQPPSPMDMWSEHISATVIGPMSLDVADMDKDGDLDILSIGWSHNRVLLYENKAINP